MGNRIIRISCLISTQGAIKSQALADFAVELSPQPAKAENPEWILHVDGSSNNRSCGAGVVLEGPGDILIEQSLKFEFNTSNNQAEYEAIIVGLNLAIDLEVKKLLCKSDSQLVVSLLKEEFEVRETLLQQYYHFVQGLIAKFDEVTI